MPGRREGRAQRRGRSPAAPGPCSAARASSAAVATRRSSAPPASSSRSQASSRAAARRRRAARQPAPRRASRRARSRRGGAGSRRPAAVARAVAASVAHSRSAGSRRSSHEPASTAPRRSLRERATKSGRPSARELAEAAQDLEAVVGREVEVEAGVERDLLAVDAGAAAAPRARSANQRLQMLDGIVVGRRLAIDPRRSLDVHQHVAAAALGDAARASPGRRRRRCR